MHKHIPFRVSTDASLTLNIMNDEYHEYLKQFFYIFLAVKWDRLYYSLSSSLTFNLSS